jgi:hypothetical protein
LSWAEAAAVPVFGATSLLLHAARPSDNVIAAIRVLTVVRIALACLSTHPYCQFD